MQNRHLFHIRVVAGILFWLAVGTSLFYLQRLLPGGYLKLQKHLGETAPYDWAQERSTELFYLLDPLDVEIRFRAWVGIKAGDKLYWQTPQLDGSNRQEIGVVYAKKEEPGSGDWIVHTRIYPRFCSQIGEGSTFALVKEPIHSRWIITTLLPADRRAQMQKDLAEYLQEHMQELRSLILPFLREMLQDSYQILHKNFPIFMETHRQEIEQQLQQLKKKYLEQELIPLLQETMWPIVAAEAKKELEPVVNEMWKKLPKGELVWLWVYQTLPGVEKDQVRRRLEKYCKTEVVAILKKYQSNLEEVPTRIVREIGKQPKIKESLRNTLQKFSEDKDLMEFAKNLAHKFYQQNEREIISHWQQKWNSPELQQRLNELALKLEPYLVRMVNRILLSANGKEISPELAEVLRKQVLFKDRYAIYVTPGQMAPGNRHKQFTGVAE